jgi:hypothetical protein
VHCLVDLADRAGQQGGHVARQGSVIGVRHVDLQRMRSAHAVRVAAEACPPPPPQTKIVQAQIDMPNPAVDGCP